MILTKDDLNAMDKLRRVQLATSLPGIKPMCLVGTQSRDKITNLAPFSSVVHLGSNPLLIGMVTRPTTVDRHTYANIVETESWTLNHVHSGILAEAHQCSARYTYSEFEATGLEAHFVEGVTAPFVAQSRVRYALELRELIDISSNNTKLIVGEVVVIDIEEQYLQADGGIDLPRAGSLASTALDTYFEGVLVGQYAYAKADH